MGIKYLSKQIRTEMNIVINGGSRGIGKQIVQYLAKDNKNKLIVTGRNKHALNELAGKFPNVIPLVTDLSDFDSKSSDFHNSVSGAFESVDILINTAGLLIPKRFVDFSNSEARRIMETNFFGPPPLSGC